MPGLKWTKTYDLKVDARHFRIAISEHEGSGFHASCLWYDEGRVLKVPGQPGYLEFHLEQRHAKSEVEVVAAIRKWVIEKFGESYSIAEAKV